MAGETVVKAKASEFMETMDFLELAFKQYNMPEPRFEKILPDLYQPDDASMANIFLLRHGAKIASSAGLFPMKLKLWGRSFTAQGIGGVGTLPEFRGHGSMSAVLDAIAVELKQRESPFAWLSGLRSRYAPWGYEKAGYAQLVIMTARNAKGVTAPGFAVSELSYDALPWSDLIALRACGPLTAGDAPLEELKIKYRRPQLRFFSAVDGASKTFCVFSSENGNIVEWHGSSDGLLAISLQLLKEREEIQIRLPLDGSCVFGKLLPLVEDHSIIMQGSFAVSDLEGCLKLACLNPAARELAPFGHRTVSFRLKGQGQEAWLALDNGSLSCGSGPGETGEELILPPQHCAALLFGPLKPSQLLGKTAPSWLDHLLPLPVLIPRLYWV